MFTGCLVHLFGWKCSGVEENCDICEFYLTLVKIKILIGNKKVGKAPGNLWNIFELWKLFDVKEVPTRGNELCHPLNPDHMGPEGVSNNTK